MKKMDQQENPFKYQAAFKIFKEKLLKKGKLSIILNGVGAAIYFRRFGGENLY